MSVIITLGDDKVPPSVLWLMETVLNIKDDTVTVLKDCYGHFGINRTMTTSDAALIVLNNDLNILDFKTLFNPMHLDFLRDTSPHLFL